MTFDLQLGAIDLLGTANTSPGYWFDTYGDDLDLGTPEAVEKEITSFLQDGSIATIESWDNRTLTLPVGIRATSAANLAAAESALVAEVGIRNALTYTPSGNGSPCVFDVVNSKLAFDFDDVLEANSLTRVYSLTIVALPFARTAATTTASWAAPPAGTPTVTTVDDCTSTTGWARTTTGTGTASGPTVVSGTLQASMTSTVPSGPQVISVTETRTGLSASMTSTPYVRLDAKTTAATSTGGFGPALSVKINGTTVTPVAAGGSVRWYAMPGGATTLTSIAVAATLNVNPGDQITVIAADVSRSSATFDVAGQRQTFRSVTIAGSARTQGSIALSDATPAALGSVLVYTSPANAAVFQPPLRAFLTSGNTQTTDTSLISGKSSDLSTLHTFDIPASQVPAGGYVLMARVKHASASTYDVTWTGRSRMGSTNLDSNPPTSVKPVALAAATWKVVNLGNLTLPTATLGASGLVRIELSGPSGLLLDEAWLFNIWGDSAGRLSWVECGTGSPASGGPASVLFLDPASLASPVPHIRIGTASDGSDAYDPGVLGSLISFGDHEFRPGQMSIFTVSSNSIAMAGSVTYSPRYMTHVA